MICSSLTSPFPLPLVFSAVTMILLLHPFDVPRSSQICVEVALACFLLHEIGARVITLLMIQHR